MRLFGLCCFQEAEAFAESQNYGTKDLGEIAKKMAALPKVNSNKPRIVIITHGDQATCVANGEFPYVVIAWNNDFIVWRINLLYRFISIFTRSRVTSSGEVVACERMKLHETYLKEIIEINLVL